MINIREYCYDCNRAKESCVCAFIKPFYTNTKFIFLMHPKEYKKTKNNTGKITHQSLLNSKIFVGIDFSHNKEINSIINDSQNACFILYPGSDSINLNKNTLDNKKQKVIFLIDSTWACSKKMLRVSKNLHSLKKISFDHDKSSQFKIKTQPNKHCLSTIESTLCVIEELNKKDVENIEDKYLEEFLNPFSKMVDYQIDCIKSVHGNVRYKVPYKS